MKITFISLMLILLIFLAACSAQNFSVQPTFSPTPAITMRVGTAIASTVELSGQVTPVPPVRSTTEPIGTASSTDGIPENGITFQDGGKTFHMHVGESFLLNLGMDFYDWSVEVDQPSVLSREVNIMVIRGAQGVYLANAPGRAVLTAVGDPQCAKVSPPCLSPSILFTVTILVQ